MKFCAQIGGGAIVCLIIQCIFLQGLLAQEEPNPYKFTLDDLEEGSEKENTVMLATQTAQELREAPSIVTVITAEEIRHTPARDLRDILYWVAGIDFGVDVESVVGIGMRGNWAHEGKVLLMIDGIEMNELLYGTTQFGANISPDIIERIEIIRGPGSAIYGGFAEFGVINIITKGASNYNGIEAQNFVGTTINGAFRQSFTTTIGRQIGDVNLNLSLHQQNSFLSDLDYTDIFGTSFNMLETSEVFTRYVNAGVEYKGLKIRGIFNRYQMQMQDAFVAATSIPYGQRFESSLLQASYTWEPHEKLRIEPQLNYQAFAPWNSTVFDILPVDQDKLSVYDMRARRYRAGVRAFYQYSEKLLFTVGSEYFRDEATTQQRVFYNGSQFMNFSNLALYAQGLWETPYFNLTFGARYDNHSYYTSTFVPRLGITKAWEKLHVKVLYSNAFRAPTLENINLGLATDIRPELTTVLEAEVGYRFSDKLRLTANLYDMTTNDVIIYLFNPNTNEEGYANFDPVGTRGAELELQWKAKKHRFTFNYSFYTTAGKPTIIDFGVPNRNANLGLAPHKLTLRSNIALSAPFYLNFALVGASRRWGYESPLQNGEVEITDFDPYLMANLSLQVRGIFREGIDLSISCFDIFNQAPPFIQPYLGEHAAMPNLSREFVAKLSITLPY
ncbi:MAG: TonB-dependent receptor plug domain-containing protein [Bernardetiaceae bacterium]|nr:TonB-dependent receptor plug domain-containing protein [Bernardetiaceae bacterium]